MAIDIVGVLPVFLSLTHGLSAQKRHKVVRESGGTALLTGLCFIALREVIFRILGITTDDFKIAGGLVLLVLSIIDLVRRPDDKKSVAGEIGIVPIGVPLIVGPAVLTTLIVLVDHYGIVAAGISFLANLLIVWVILRKSSAIVALLGESGIGSVSKIMSLLLASIAVMMIRLGIQNIIGNGAH